MNNKIVTIDTLLYFYQKLLTSIPTLSAADIRVNSTEVWMQDLNLILPKNTVAIYSDFKEVEGKKVSGFKVSDGVTKLNNIPFQDAYLETQLINHINNTTIHTSAEEKALWNSKVSASVSGEVLSLN